MLQWHYSEALKTGNDFFVLPPIGHTCNYPSQQSEPDLSEFVRLTEVDATVIGTTASVAWEWWDTWHTAMQTYLPKYATKNKVRSGYAVNVPFFSDTLVTWTYNNFNVYGAKYVLFRPHVWRGTKGSLVPGEHDTLLSVAEMASQINSYPKGTATHIYLTSDGGGNLQYDLAAAFDDHVEVVSHNVLADMALERWSRLCEREVDQQSPKKETMVSICMNTRTITNRKKRKRSLTTTPTLTRTKTRVRSPRSTRTRTLDTDTDH